MSEISDSPSTVEFLIGSVRLERTLGRIAHQAAVQGTPHAFRVARDRICGIRWLFDDLIDSKFILVMNKWEHALGTLAEGSEDNRQVFCASMLAGERKTDDDAV